MTNRTVAALVAAVAATAVAGTAITNAWAIRTILAAAAGTAWTLFAVLGTSDRVIARIDRAVADAHTEGVIEGMRRATPTQPLRGVH